MSEKKLGLFIHKKADATSAAPVAPSTVSAKPKNVQQRWIYVGGGAVLLMVASSVLLKSPPPSQTPSQKAVAQQGVPSISVEPPNAKESEFTTQFGKQQAVQQQELNELKSQLRSYQRDASAANKAPATTGGTPAAPAVSPPANVVAPPTPSQDNTGGIAALSKAPPGPPAPPARLEPVKVPAVPSLPAMVPPVPMLSSSSLAAPGAGTASSGPLVFEAPAISTPAATGSADTEQAKANSVNAKTRVVKNPSAGMLPAGAFASVALLNGVDAGTSTATQSNPLPVLMNITDQATLPGSAKYQLKSCFILGTGYGDLSAERVYVRVSRLSCVDKKDQLVLSQEIAGYLVDSDGKLGLRGLVTDRQGAKLGKAMLAGFAQGLAGAMGQAQNSVATSLTSGMTTATATGANALRASGLSGAQMAASQLAEFYLKEAQSVFPVITVDASRTGTIVFTNSVSLSWGSGSGQFVEQVQPLNR
jgi:conjugal transfer pilus assembly protein TraB